MPRVSCVQESNIPIRIQTGQIRDIQKQILELLRRLTNTPIDDIPPSTTSGDTDGNTNLLISRLTTLIGEPNSAEDRSEGNIDTIEALVGEEKPTRHADFEYINNGTLLLEAIQQGKKEEIDSLL